MEEEIKSMEADQNGKTEETMADYARELEASFRKIKEDDILSGTVISVNEEEAILDLKYYTQGIIKAEDMSQDPHFNMMESVKPGDVIEATVISTDDGEGNIRLSRKEAAAVLAWDVLKKDMEEGTNLTVKISEVVKSGVVAYVEGIRGFLPASQLSLTYVEDLEAWKGREVEARVITVDPSRDKLVLSAKVIEKERSRAEQDHRISMIAPGSVLEGTVESLMPYGAFVALSDGLSGLVHISQISQKRINKPSEVLTVGEKVRVKVLNTRDNKISLSIKAVQENSTVDELEGKRVSDFNSGEEVTTSLGDLFAKLKL